MPSWNELLAELQALPPEKQAWFASKGTEALQRVSALTADANVVLYASAFLQKPEAPSQSLSITHEDINGLMSVVYGMDWTKPLVLIVHTPGGSTNAAEAVSEYLRTKFTAVTTIVPALAMSAGTMISLSSEEIVMGRQSQLGPIDPQMGIGGRWMSARAIVDQFQQARRQIIRNTSAAHVWAPVLASLGPSLLVEAKNALDYGERMVARWLATYMLAGDPDAVAKGRAIASFFNDAGTHKSHGRRIDREAARSVGVNVRDLEADQDLQDAVLTAYHVITLVFEQTPVVKALWTNHERTWFKQWNPSQR